MINLKSLRTLKALAICSLLSIPAVSNAQGCTAPPSDMVGWWPFDGNTDEIVLGYDGILQGGTYSAGKVLQGYQSQGYTDFVEVPDNNDLDLGSEFSIDAWVKINALNSDNMPIIWKGNSSGTDYTTPYSILVLRDNIPDAGKLAVIIGNGSTAQIVTSNTPLSLQVQHMIAVVSDGQNLNIYINGVLDKTEPLGATPYNSSYPLQIGGVKNLASHRTNYFNGVIDEVEIFNRAITTNEIVKIYRADKAGKCKTPCAEPPANMVGWWPFDGNTNELVLNNNGILQGGTYAPGMVLQGYQSQAYTDFVEVPDNNNLDLGAEFSIDAWVKINALNSDNMPIIWKGNPAGTDYTSAYSILVLRGNIPDAGKIAVLTGDGSFANTIISNSALSLQTQHLIAVVSDGQNVSIYIDGVLDKTEPLGVTPYNSSYPLQIGGVKDLASNRTNFFNGVIDEVEIFNGAISHNDILSIYNAGPSGKCKGSIFPSSSPKLTREFKNDQSEIKIYPNPAEDQVTLEIDRKVLNTYKSMKLRLIDNQGRMIKEINSINSRKTKIDIQELKGGVYVYQLLSNGQIITTGKLIK